MRENLRAHPVRATYPLCVAERKLLTRLWGNRGGGTAGITAAVSSTF